MKKFLKMLPILPMLLIGADMPPMPPGMIDNKANTKEVKVEDVKKEETKQEDVKGTFPKECDIIPPMLIMLPPQLSADLTLCKNALHKPSSEKVFEALKTKLKVTKDKELEIVSVENLESFSELYLIIYKHKGKEKKVLTNSAVTKFLTYKEF